VVTKHPCSTSHIFDSQIKEKDKIINQLKGQLEESQLINSNIEADFKTHHDVEIKELESEIQRLRTEKITIQMENEQLYNSLKCMEDTNKKLKSIYDERLNDKD
jgi:predicted RNase H-like nuclease (RuvC/YqgF family)